MVLKQGWDEGISAVLLKLPASDRSVVGVNATHSLGRRNFSLAHELGHLVLDHPGQVIQRHDSCAEREADWFATEFLLPKRLLVSWCEQLEVREPRMLARRIGLSFRMVERRFEELGLR